MPVPYSVEETGSMTKPSEDIVLLSHGGGGRLTRRLISDRVLRHFNNPILDPLEDAACLTIPETDIVFTTDSYVVDPVFFPGGDIGKLAACGTINDLVMQGAEPRYLSLGLILEEGFPLSDLDRILESLGQVLRENQVLLATGDTKVVGRGQANGIYINTTGIGVRRTKKDTALTQARAGDDILLTGTLGDHGIAILSQRPGMRFESPPESDVAPLWDLLRPVFESQADIRVLRDPTRGGLAAALCDLARAAGAGVHIDEGSLPISPPVSGACALLGLDPISLPNEGKALIVCPPADTPGVLSLLRSHPLGQRACRIGTVQDAPPGLVLLHTKLGGQRIVDEPSGENLPRIC